MKGFADITTLSIKVEKLAEKTPDSAQIASLEEKIDKLTAALIPLVEPDQSPAQTSTTAKYIRRNRFQKFTIESSSNQRR